MAIRVSLVPPSVSLKSAREGIWLRLCNLSSDAQQHQPAHLRCLLTTITWNGPWKVHSPPCPPTLP